MTLAPDLHFLLPDTIAAEQFIADLDANGGMRKLARLDGIKTYYDSFDWRLYDANFACTVTGQGQNLRLNLYGLESGTILASLAIPVVPVFAEDIADATARKILSEVLEMRALQPMLTQSVSDCEYALVDKRGKTVSRLYLETLDKRTRIHLQALKGYEKALSQWAELLQQQFALLPLHPTAWSEELRRQKQSANHQTYKPHLYLHPGMRANVAGRKILVQLLETLKSNEPGVLEHIDSEFLHDFRVAIRKTRAALGQLKGIFPDAETQKYREFFSWLGQVTGPARDMDVYLLNFPGYKTSLPAAIREDLNPLHDFLAGKQRQAQHELAINLRSQRYKQGLAEWENFLHATPRYGVAHPVAPNAAAPARDFAAQRIWRIYRRALRQGAAIDDGSAPEALHELRKTCKKLRYLMEFFHCLFPATDIAASIKTLRVLQEVLGNFQDYQVQEERLKHFSEEMLHAEIPAATFLAMGVLIQHLDELRRIARADFAKRFADFQSAAHRTAFASLFAPQT